MRKAQMIEANELMEMAVEAAKAKNWKKLENIEMQMFNWLGKNAEECYGEKIYMIINNVAWGLSKNLPCLTARA